MVFRKVGSRVVILCTVVQFPASGASVLCPAFLRSWLCALNPLRRCSAHKVSLICHDCNERDLDLSYTIVRISDLDATTKCLQTIQESNFSIFQNHPYSFRRTCKRSKANFRFAFLWFSWHIEHMTRALLTATIYIENSRSVSGGYLLIYVLP